MNLIDNISYVWYYRNICHGQKVGKETQNLSRRCEVFGIQRNIKIKLVTLQRKAIKMVERLSNIGWVKNFPKKLKSNFPYLEEVITWVFEMGCGKETKLDINLCINGLEETKKWLNFVKNAVSLKSWKSLILVKNTKEICQTGNGFAENVICYPMVDWRNY